MPLIVGTQLGSHEITALLGKGGMGEVYRARDLKLKREVAIKILPEEFARDADRLSRFQREAEALASLNHPNVAAIYDIQEFGASRFIVLELVEGETLAERIQRGLIPLDEALRISADIAEALAAAHEKGIVHRDLKPANVKLTPDGKVKVLDFGLAKSASPSDVNAGLSNSPTLMSMAATNAGIILGTAAYMSPEQARGQTVDKRSDIWAFGVVVYEMLTGKSPFAGPTVSDTLALVLTKDPDLSEIPERVRLLVRRCMERDVQKRLRDIGDASILIEAAAIASAFGAPSAAAAPAKRVPMILGLAAAIGITTAAALAVVHFNEGREPLRTVQFEIQAEGVRANSLTVSPDGRFLTFDKQDPTTGRRTVHIRALDSLQTKTLPEPPSSRLTWSLDSRYVVFFSSGKLKRVAAEGGPVETLFDAGGVFSQAPVATRDGWLYRSGAGDVMQVPASGGAPTTFIPAAQALPMRLSGLHFLPDGRHFLFSANEAAIAGTSAGIFAASIEALGANWKASPPLAVTDETFFSFAPLLNDRQGYIFFMRDGALAAQRFDNEKLQVSGPAVTIAASVSDFAASRDVLAYRSGPLNQTQSQLRWFDRQGRQVGTLGQPGTAGGDVWLSRDGKTVFIDRAESGTSRALLGDTARGVFSRLTSTNATETAGALTPDGSVIFTVGAAGVLGDLYVLRSNSSTPELLAKSEFVKHPNDVSPDGKYLIYDVHGVQLQDLWILPLNAGNNAKPIPFLATAADETFGQFSPDGKWVAYRSTESGRPEVYVRAFQPDQSPASGAKKWLVSTAGGDKPRWSRDGKELYYVAPGGKMMATPVKTGAAFEPGIPVQLFEAQFSGYFPYDTGLDGRFLINTPLAPAQAPASNPAITVMLNWSSTLNKNN